MRSPHAQPPGHLPHPEYGQGPTGEPHHGPPPHGQPHGQPHYGQPHYGQPHYGQPHYGQPQYPQYGQPPYGPQAWGPPGGHPPKKSSNTAIVLVVGAVLFLAVIAAGLFFLLQAGDPGGGAASSTADSPSDAAPNGGEGIPPATVTPDGLGNDPDLDQLAEGCYDGDMQACDDLYQVAELDSRYGIYGGTCAGRQDVSDADTIFCTSAFPED